MKKPSLSIILGVGKPKPGAEKGLGQAMSDGNEEMPEDMSYSEEQMEMAKELVDAVKGGEPEALLKAIHGIFESYKMMESHEE